jgi:hypothetical protein
MKFYQLAFLLIFLSTSCKDDTETQAQLTAKKLTADIKSSGAIISEVLVSSIYDGSRIFYGTRYTINSDGFIIITDTSSATFNLGELKSYIISPSSLTLYY